MGTILLEDIATTVAQLKDEVLFIENEIEKYHQDMNKQMEFIYKKIDNNEDYILDPSVWINEYLMYNK